jgi:hypothetical protein
MKNPIARRMGPVAKRISLLIGWKTEKAARRLTLGLMKGDERLPAY